VDGFVAPIVCVVGFGAKSGPRGKSDTAGSLSAFCRGIGFPFLADVLRGTNAAVDGAATVLFVVVGTSLSSGVSSNFVTLSVSF